VGPRDIEHAVVNVLRFIEPRAAIIFCHTRESVRRLHGSLLERGFDVVALSGELSQSERTHALQALRDGHARVCVATDVAARGLDLPDLGLVIHAEIPTNKETLLHRSGRTGRAGRKGVCALLVPHSRRRRVEGLLHAANVTATWSDPPLPDAIRVRDQERMLADPVLTEAPTDEDMVLAQNLLQGRSAEQIAAALIRLYRSRLPEPEELFIAPIRDERPDRKGPRVDGYDRRDDRAPREPRVPREFRGGENMVQFKISAGRNANADPKWILPMLCRRGKITKQEIGAIRIFDRESIVEISQEAAAGFAEAIKQSPDNDVRITLNDGTQPLDRDHGKPAERRDDDRGPPRAKTGYPKQDRPRGDRPQGDRPQGDRPRSDRPRHDRPASDRPKYDRPAAERTASDRSRGERVQGEYVKSDRPTKRKDDRDGRVASGDARPDHHKRDKPAHGKGPGQERRKPTPESREASAKKLKKKLKKLNKNK
ncbi:MAG TPA: helicase-related protein, partial [Dongiaceae bacterium]